MPHKSINDQYLSEVKGLQSGGNLPFPSYGSGWGSIQGFESEAAWSSYIDSQYAGSVNNTEKYRRLVGDLSRNSLVMAAVRFASNALPEAPLQVREKTGGTSGKKGKSKVIDNHKLTKLWNRPNDFYDGVTLVKGLAFSLVLQGNAYIIKNNNEVGLWPVELWWEPHWTIRPIWPVDGSQFISGYEVNRNGTWYPLPVENVIHIRDGFHPYNLRIGNSGNDSVLPELYGDSEAASYYATLMGGSGIPGFMVAIDKEMKLDQPAAEALEKLIVRKTTGDRKGQPLVVKGGRAYKLGFNPRELDLRESRYMAEDRFCASQGVPAVVLELGSGQAHSIYNNVNMAMDRAWRSYVCPKLTMIENALNLHLLEDFDGEDSGRYCEHDLSQVQSLQEDVDKKATRLENLFAKGAIMRSELRSSLGFDSSIDGDEEIDKVFFIPKGGSLVKPNEEPLAQGEQIIDMVTGEIRAGAPPPALPGADMGFGMSQPGEGPLAGFNSQETSNKPLLSLAKALVTDDLAQSIQNLLPAEYTAAREADDKLKWTNFPDHMGSLGIPRTSMPQVLNAHRGALISFLRGRGIKYSKENILPGQLMPSQQEFTQTKVDKAKSWTGKDRPILVSSDGYIADAHHQWLADLQGSPDSTIPIFRFDAPILELLLNLAMFPSSGVKDENDESQFWNTKSMPSKGIVTKNDVTQTISFLKKYRYGQAAAMMQAKRMLPTKLVDKKSNGDSEVLST